MEGSDPKAQKVGKQSLRPCRRYEDVVSLKLGSTLIAARQLLPWTLEFRTATGTMIFIIQHPFDFINIFLQEFLEGSVN